jgi:hypothetical protein
LESMWLTQCSKALDQGPWRPMAAHGGCRCFQTLWGPLRHGSLTTSQHVSKFENK